MKYLIRLLVKICPMHFLIASVAEMGWGISFDDDDDIVQGLIIGTSDFIEGK